MDVEGAQKVFTKVEIPIGSVPGGCFDYTTPNGNVVSVSVPMTASPGQFIDVCIDEEDQDGEIEFKMKKSTIGAAVAGNICVNIDSSPAAHSRILVYDFIHFCRRSDRNCHLRPYHRATTCCWCWIYSVTDMNLYTALFLHIVLHFFTFHRAKGIEKLPQAKSTLETVGKHSFTGMIMAKDWSSAR